MPSSTDLQSARLQLQPSLSSMPAASIVQASGDKCSACRPACTAPKPADVAMASTTTDPDLYPSPAVVVPYCCITAPVKAALHC